MFQPNMVMAMLRCQPVQQAIAQCAWARSPDLAKELGFLETKSQEEADAELLQVVRSYLEGEFGSLLPWSMLPIFRMQLDGQVLAFKLWMEQPGHELLDDPEVQRAVRATVMAANASQVEAVLPGVSAPTMEKANRALVTAVAQHLSRKTRQMFESVPLFSAYQIPAEQWESFLECWLSLPSDYSFNFADPYRVGEAFQVFAQQ